jgi:hypothetical protein
VVWLFHHAEAYCSFVWWMILWRMHLLMILIWIGRESRKEVEIKKLGEKRKRAHPFLPFPVGPPGSPPPLVAHPSQPPPFSLAGPPSSAAPPFPAQQPVRAQPTPPPPRPLACAPGTLALGPCLVVHSRGPMHSSAREPAPHVRIARTRLAYRGCRPHLSFLPSPKPPLSLSPAATCATKRGNRHHNLLECVRKGKPPPRCTHFPQPCYVPTSLACRARRRALKHAHSRRCRVFNLRVLGKRCPSEPSLPALCALGNTSSQRARWRDLWPFSGRRAPCRGSWGPMPLSWGEPVYLSRSSFTLGLPLGVYPCAQHTHHHLAIARRRPLPRCHVRSRCPHII